jgi:hypothetical protein
MPGTLVTQNTNVYTGRAILGMGFHAAGVDFINHYYLPDLQYFSA